MNNITLDTLLTDIGYDNACDINEGLIDLELAGGDNWGREWAQVQDMDGTVKDLRDFLYENAAE